MQKKIEVGMLVRVIHAHPSLSYYIGHVGRVLAKCKVHENSWDVEGVISPFGCQMSTHESSLEPIYPNHEPCGESFSDMLKNLRGVEA